MKTTEEKIASLPKWAQELITHLRHKLQDSKEHIANLSNSFVDNSQKTDVNVYSHYMEPNIPLPSDADVCFAVTPHNCINVRLKTNEFTGTRSLAVMGNGCDTMLVKFHASNCFDIVFDLERKL